MFSDSIVLLKNKAIKLVTEMLNFYFDKTKYMQGVHVQR